MSFLQWSVSTLMEVALVNLLVHGVKWRTDLLTFHLSCFALCFVFVFLSHLVFRAGCAGHGRLIYSNLLLAHVLLNFCLLFISLIHRWAFYFNKLLCSNSFSCSPDRAEFLIWRLYHLRVKLVSWRTAACICDFVCNRRFHHWWSADFFHYMHCKTQGEKKQVILILS